MLVRDELGAWDSEDELGDMEGELAQSGAGLCGQVMCLDLSAPECEHKWYWTWIVDLGSFGPNVGSNLAKWRNALDWSGMRGFQQLLMPVTVADIKQLEINIFGYPEV